MTDEKEEKKESHLVEDLEAAGQMIIGGIETVGGIITADAFTRAEGEYNIDAGKLHHESNEALEEGEELEEQKSETTIESNRNE